MDLRPLSETFGAEVIGASLDGTEAGTLRELLWRHQLLLFRGLDLSPARQLMVTGQFGGVDKPWDPTHAHEDEPLLEVFHASPPRPYRRPAEHWHSDGSFLAEPTSATLLYAVIVPESGGATHYSDTRAAYRTLPDALRKRIAGRRAVHSFARQFSKLRQASQRVSAAEAAEERAVFPDVEHGLVRAHPVTGEPALYLNELCLDRVAGLSSTESDELLAELYAHALADEFEYVHEWRPGDLLVWDNPSLLHRASPVHSGRRLVHRSTAQYEAPRGTRQP